MSKREVSIKELQDEFEEKLAVLQKRLGSPRGPGRERSRSDELTMAQLKELLRRRRRFVSAREIVEDTEEMVRDHPILVVAVLWPSASCWARSRAAR